MQFDGVCPSCTKTWHLKDASAVFPEHSAASGSPNICPGSSTPHKVKDVCAPCRQAFPSKGGARALPFDLDRVLDAVDRSMAH